MIKTTIKSINIENFRGIKKAVVAFDSKENKICLPNGYGKSTLKVAFNWCLGATISDFIPKENNKEIEDLTTLVELKLTVDGLDYTLTRKSTGKYKLNEDTNTKSKITNESKYYIDTIELAEKDYIAKIMGIFKAEIKDIKFLTELGYFSNDRADFAKKQRKKMLFEICGVQQSINDLLGRNDFDSIHDLVVKGFSTAEIKSMIAKERKGYKDKINEYQILINQKSNEISEYETIDYEKIAKQISDYEKELSKLISMSENAAKSTTMAETMEKVSTLRQELAKITLEDSKNQEKLRNTALELFNKCKNMGEQIKENESEISTIEEKISRLERNKTENVETVCPLCNQKLPKSKVEATIAELDKQISERAKRVEALRADNNQLIQKYNEIKEQYMSAKAKLDNFEKSPKIDELSHEINLLDKTIEEDMKSQSNGSISAKKDSIIEKIKELSAELSKNEILADGNNKINAWKSESLQLSNNLIETEKKDIALIKFMKEQSKVVETTVNSYFENGVTWALFNTTYKNGDGGVEEECCPLYKGTRYESLSTGEKYICDIEIIKSLQKIYGCNMPLFIDNAEGITLDVPFVDTQTIMLEANKDIQNINIITFKQQIKEHKKAQNSTQNSKFTEKNKVNTTKNAENAK